MMNLIKSIDERTNNSKNEKRQMLLEMFKELWEVIEEEGNNFYFCDDNGELHQLMYDEIEVWTND